MKKITVFVERTSFEPDYFNDCIAVSMKFSIPKEMILDNKITPEDFKHREITLLLGSNPEPVIAPKIEKSKAIHPEAGSW